MSEANSADATDAPAQPDSERPTQEPKPDDDAVVALTKRTLEAPLMSFVKGGTTTSGYEKQVAAEWHDAESRRDAAEEDRKLAAVPIERGGARMFTNKLTANPEITQAYVELVFANGIGFGKKVCADILMEDFDNPADLSLQFVCPKCLKYGPRHQDQCQLKMRMSKKHWELVTGVGPPTFEFEGKIYKSAGVVKLSDQFNCPDCGWRAVIEHNQIREL